MAKYDRDVLLEDLRKNVMAVYFTKVKTNVNFNLRTDVVSAHQGLQA